MFVFIGLKIIKIIRKVGHGFAYSILKVRNSNPNERRRKMDKNKLVEKIKERIEKDGFVILPTYYKIIKVLDVWNETRGTYIKAQGYKRYLALTICQIQYLAQ